MATATRTPRPAPQQPPANRYRTVADLLKELGVPPQRVRLQPTPGTATEKDLLKACAEKPLCELVEGTLVEKPMGMRESLLAAVIIELMGGFVRRRHLGAVFAPDAPHRMGVRLVRLPDVAFISRARLATIPRPLPQIAPIGPDLAVEVLSPSNRPGELARKRREYFGAGTRLVWQIDPRKRTAEVFTAPTVSTRFDESQSLDGGAVVPGFSLSLRDLFAEADELDQP
jgi:Uma2 family endonuclease